MTENKKKSVENKTAAPDVLDKLESDDIKSAWIVKDQFQIGLQIEGGRAYFSLENTESSNLGHEFAVSVGEDGKVTMQVCQDKKVVTVDLFKALSGLKKIVQC